MFRPAPGPSPRRESSGDKIYDTRRWRRIRLLQLREFPICKFVDDPRHGEECQRVASQVDHVKPISSGGEPFDAGNLRSLCATAHSRITARWRREGVNELPGGG
jgi:5-methylcytosine-specific restriction endonuclease McrA